MGRETLPVRRHTGKGFEQVDSAQWKMAIPVPGTISEIASPVAPVPSIAGSNESGNSSARHFGSNGRMVFKNVGMVSVCCRKGLLLPGLLGESSPVERVHPRRLSERRPDSISTVGRMVVARQLTVETRQLPVETQLARQLYRNHRPESKRGIH